MPSTPYALAPAGYAPTPAARNESWSRLAFSGIGASSPHGKGLLVPVSGSQEAAFSHSSSVGRRLPAHRAYASASYHETCTTGAAGFKGSSKPKRCVHQLCSSSWYQCFGAAMPSSLMYSQPLSSQSSFFSYPPASTNSTKASLVTGVLSIKKSGRFTTCASRSLSRAHLRSLVPITNSPAGTGTISPSTELLAGNSICGSGL